MTRRFPFFLFRHIAADLLRLIFIAATVLVVVISMAATVKPLSDGLLQADNLVKFIAYAIPVMLAYAVPFAAGFGATLVYHRLAADNEATAAYASGISHKALLGAALAIGLGLSGLLTALNEVVIPYFLLQMQRLITRDLATWVIQEIDKGKSVDVGGMMLHAASAKRLAPAPGSTASDVIYLTRVAAIDRDNAGKPINEVTSERAWIFLFPPDDRGGSEASAGTERGKSRVVMRLENLVGNRERMGGVGAKDFVDVAWSVASGFRDNVKFLSWRDLIAIEQTPERINWVDVPRKELAIQTAKRRVTDGMLAAATNGKAITLRDDRGAPVTIERATMKLDPADQQGRTWLVTAPGGEDIRLHMARHGVASPANSPTITVTAREARLTFDTGADRLDRSLSIQIELRDAAVSEDQGGQRSERGVYRVSSLRPDPDPSATLLSLSTPELLGESTRLSPTAASDPEFAGSVRELERALRKLHLEVRAKRHERLAMAVSCFVMVMTGAVIALRLSRQTPLAVYMFTFIPAVVCIVTISGGQQLTVQGSWAGLYVMWGGVLGLLLYTLAQYRSLARH
jgi:lipopolysaccharide export system permease protein